MTQDQIIQMLHKVIAENSNFATWTLSTPHLVALVNHAIEAEREACAEICEKFADQDIGPDGIYIDYHAYLIRARSEV